MYLLDVVKQSEKSDHSDDQHQEPDDMKVRKENVPENDIFEALQGGPRKKNEKKRINVTI